MLCALVNALLPSTDDLLLPTIPTTTQISYSHDILVAIYVCISIWKLLEPIEPTCIDCDEYGIEFPAQYDDSRRLTRRVSVVAGLW